MTTNKAIIYNNDVFSKFEGEINGYFEPNGKGI
jgi:hypothetical protein